MEITIYHKQNKMRNEKTKLYYVLTVDISNGYENIWRGDNLSEGIHYRDIAIKHWGKNAVALLPAE